MYEQLVISSIFCGEDEDVKVFVVWSLLFEAEIPGKVDDGLSGQRPSAFAAGDDFGAGREVIEIVINVFL